MTVKIFCKKGLGIPNLRSRQNAVIHFFGEKLLGFPRNDMVQLFSRQGRRLCPILERSENSVLIERFCD